MQVSDFFITCKVCLSFDNINFKPLFQFFDIISGDELILPDKIHEQIQEHLQQVSESIESLPPTMTFYGHFVRDSENIYVHELYTAQLMLYKITTCFLQPIQGALALIDEDTGMPVAIGVHNDQEFRRVVDVIKAAAADSRCDYSIDGSDRLAVIGNTSIVDDDSIRYDFDDAFLIDNSIGLTEIIYEYIINESSDEDEIDEKYSDED